MIGISHILKMKLSENSWFEVLSKFIKAINGSLTEAKLSGKIFVYKLYFTVHVQATSHH